MSKEALERENIGLPPGETLLEVVWSISTGWYAKTEHGWHWYDERVAQWKPSLYGPAPGGE